MEDPAFYEDFNDEGEIIYKTSQHANEGVTMNKTEYKRCWLCGHWKLAQLFTGSVLLSYPAKYECLDCVEGRNNDLINKRLKEYQDQYAANVVYASTIYKNPQEVLLPYKGKSIPNNGVIFMSNEESK